jgi:hypothetical protein
VGFGCEVFEIGGVIAVVGRNQLTGLCANLVPEGGVTVSATNEAHALRWEVDPHLFPGMGAEVTGFAMGGVLVLKRLPCRLMAAEWAGIGINDVLAL